MEHGTEINGKVTGEIWRNSMWESLKSSGVA